jgi:transcriptional regulator with XRE-family HTH domain
MDVNGLVHAGKHVRAARRARNLTLQELAKRAGIHSNTISHIENEKSHPSDETLRKIAKALEQPEDSFILPISAGAQATEDVEARLWAFRESHADIFENWTNDRTDERWQRYLALGKKFGITSDASSDFWARHVNREARYVEKFRELLQANEADEIIAKLMDVYERWNSSAPRP